MFEGEIYGTSMRTTNNKEEKIREIIKFCVVLVSG